MRSALVWLVAVLAACAADPEPASDEERVRARLGIPRDARTVVVFAQTAHLDVDWQKTFDDYYRTWVGDIFSEARHILDTQPRAHYSIAEMAYLRRHLEVHPEEQAALRGHAARGALRIVGGGVTSPDTLLPETELLLRDYLYGTRFAEETLGVRPRAAWLPDSFGHAATVPDLLAAAGFESVGFARIDGAPTFFEAVKSAAGPPPHKPGSTAAQLQQLGSADFVWRGPGGGKLVAHFIASGLYCTGDDIDYDEVLQVPGGHLGVYHGDEPSFTDAKIAGYVSVLSPYAKTPYRFVPVGCDFQHPKPELLSYLDGYNQRHFSTTGVWATAATFEDYATLVAAHRELLPELPADLEPYFMGFYGTRAGLKRRVREAARPWFAAESLAAALGAEGRAITSAAAPALERLTWTNHHDFVTGTANDQVVDVEQLPLVDEAEASGQQSLARALDELARRLPRSDGAAGRVIAFNPSGTTRTAVAEISLPAIPGPLRALSGARLVPLEETGRRRGRLSLRLVLEDMPPFGWRAIDLFAGVSVPAADPVTLQLLDSAGQPTVGAAIARVVLSNKSVRAEWKRDSEFALTSLAVHNVQAIGAPSFTTVDYDDQGGLWRTGHEMNGCRFTRQPRTLGPETVLVRVRSPMRSTVAFIGGDATREVSLDAGQDGLGLALVTAARQGTTRTAILHVVAGAPLRTSLAGGFAERPAERVYPSPTFWPAVEWASIGQWTLLLRQSTGVRLSAAGDLELMAARDARNEQCDILGGTGSDPGVHRLEWVLTSTASASAAARAAQSWNRPMVLSTAAQPPAGGDLPREGSLLSLEGDAMLSALKPADRGNGLIVRVLLLPGPAVLRLSPALASRARTRTDALERDVESLPSGGDTISLDRDRFGAIATIRLD